MAAHSSALSVLAMAPSDSKLKRARPQEAALNKRKATVADKPAACALGSHVPKLDSIY